MWAQKINKIKDWFIITRIRILNFIKEHKYVSALIGVFLLSAIIALAVRAADDEITSANVSVNSVSVATEKIEGLEDVEGTKTAPNFSNVTYNLRYTLGENYNCNQTVDEVKITAKVENKDYLKWNPGSEEVLSDIDEKEDGKTLTLTMFSVNLCSVISQNLSLSVLNAQKDSEVKITELKIKPGSAAEEKAITLAENTEEGNGKVKIETVKTGYTEDIKNLTAIVKPGVAIKKELEPLRQEELLQSSSTTGRNDKFGLLLGFYQEGEEVDLKGKYIDPNETITLQAKETVSEEETELDLSTSENDYGVYTDDIEKKHYFTFPLPVLSSSGTVTLSKSETVSREDVQADEARTTENGYSIAPVVSLYDNNLLTVEKHNNGDEKEIQKKITINNKETECNDKNNCTFTSNINFASNGTYDASYTITDETGKNTTVLKQKVTVEDSQDSTGLYALKGAKTLYIKDVKSFVDPGIAELKDEAQYKDNKVSINYYSKTSDEESVKTEYSKLEDLVKQDTSGTYIEEYKITNNDTPVTTLKREIVISDNNIQNEELKVTDLSTIEKGSKYTEKGLYVDDSQINCDSKNSCTSNINSSIFNQVGEHEITYKISNDNFDTIVTKKISVQDGNYYVLKIDGLKINNDLELIKEGDKNFYVIGSYYVTVPTDKESSVVTLSAFVNGQQEASTGKIENKKVSTGTNSITNDLYVVEDGSLVKVDNGDSHYAGAMGEKVEVDTTFNLGMDADEKIENLKIKLNIDDDLTLTSHSENVEGSENYYVQYYRYGELLEEDNLPTITLKYCEDDSSDNNCNTELDASSQDIKAIIFEFNGDIEPGTTIVLKTSYIVKTYTDEEDLSSKSFNSTATVTGTVNGESVNLNSTSNSAYVTPYKIRTDLFAGLNGSENSSSITVDTSKNNIYTVYARTSITSPAMMLNTNIFGYTNLSKVTVTFTLPKGIDYVQNQSYTIQPTSINRGSANTTLVYTYNGFEPNSWVESIYFDFAVDIATENNKTFDITSKTDVPNASGLSKDYSNASFLTDKVSVLVQSAGDASYSHNIYSSNGSQIITHINKNGAFLFKTKIYNPKEDALNNIDVITILPANDTTSNSSYSGSYEILKMPEGALCTTALSLDSSSDIASDWKECSSLNNYDDVKAYKVHYDSIGSKETKEESITIKTSGNEPGDKYNFKSYIEKDDSKISFNDVEVNVVSKMIKGIVWEDFNYNGIMESDEKRIDAVELSLYTLDGDLVDTTTPNKNGEYSFTAIEEGEYYVVADFNYDKYAITSALTNYTDLSKVSVFSSATAEEQNIINSIENDDTALDDQDEVVEDEEVDDSDAGDEDLDSGDEDLENPDGEDEEMPEPEEDEEPVLIVKAGPYNVTSDTTTINHVNLGLALRKKFSVKVNKYITRAEVTNALGVITKRDYGNTKLAKLDVKDINNLNIKVVYTIELQNVKYYPGYIKLVTEEIPDGMSFNPNYSENAGWVLNDDGTLSNSSLSNELLYENDKRYLTIAFDITRKEAGSFVNMASVDDLEILGGSIDEE